MRSTIDRPERWRVLLAPRMVVTHLLVLVVAATCIALGQWQLDRLEGVRASNARLAERAAAEPADLSTLLATLPKGPERDTALGALEFRRVRATGTFRADEEVLHRNRSLSGRQGFHVLTPLALDDGGTVLVVRGWVPAEYDEPPVREAAPPPGRVTVVGILEASTPQPRFGARDAEEGRLLRVFHADTDRLAAQITGRLAPVVLRALAGPEAASEAPVDGGTLPIVLGPPELSEANHRSYAVQWHVFAVLAVLAHLAWIRTRVTRAV
ncbi:MAG: hypothetical protein RLZZ272_1372 [Actinomycetota bacterium]